LNNSIIESEVEKLSKKALIDAANIALKYKNQKKKVCYKSESQPVTQADLEIDNFLKDYFKIKTPNYGWISEESKDDGSRYKRDFFWCLDPIDGTRSFINDKPEYTISLALIKKNIPVLGFIVNPETNEFFFAKKGGGAFCNEIKLNVGKKNKIQLCKYAISSSEEKKLSNFSVFEKNNIVKMGSIAYKIALVAKGDFDIALSFTKKNDWDVAAADLILNEAGGELRDLKGGKLVYNSTNLKIPSVVASNPYLQNEMNKIFSYNS
tara:strand:- start:4657 stop:5451 length:795 start_codon:yes stop_codon:yes gene_type:complete